MRLLIQTENAGVVAIDVPDSFDLRVRHLKQMLEIAGFEDVIFQTVFLGTAPLEDASLLHDFGISDGDVLRLGIVPLLPGDSAPTSKLDTQDKVFEPSMRNVVAFASPGCPPFTAQVLETQASTDGVPEQNEEHSDPLDDPISQFPPNISQSDPIEFTPPSPRAMRLKNKKQQATRRRAPVRMSPQGLSRASFRIFNRHLL